MKLALFGVGGVMFLMGGLWFLQGINVLSGSFMSGEPLWVAIGGSTALLGIAVGLVGSQLTRK